MYTTRANGSGGRREGGGDDVESPNKRRPKVAGNSSGQVMRAM